MCELSCSRHGSGNAVWLYARSVLLGPTIDPRTGLHVGGIVDYTEGQTWLPLALLLCAWAVIEPIQTTTSFWMLGQLRLARRPRLPEMLTAAHRPAK